MGRQAEQLNAGLANDAELFELLLDWPKATKRERPAPNSPIAMFDDRRKLERVRHRVRIAWRDGVFHHGILLRGRERRDRRLRTGQRSAREH